MLDEMTLGGIKVYIDKIPALFMCKAVMKKDASVLGDKTICAGADSILLMKLFKLFSLLYHK